MEIPDSCPLATALDPEILLRGEQGAGFVLWASCGWWEVMNL